MKVEFKLENSKYCDGCPLLETVSFFDHRCRLYGYSVAVMFDSEEKTRHLERLSECKKDNGL